MLFTEILKLLDRGPEIMCLALDKIWSGQEYRPYVLFLGVDSISRSISTEETASKKKEIG